jgi:hypothetical protein
MLSSLFVSYLACYTYFHCEDLHVWTVNYPFEQDVKYTFTLSFEKNQDPTRWLSFLVLDLERDTHFKLDKLEFPRATSDYGFSYIPHTERYSPAIYLQGNATGTLTVCKSWW